MEGVGRRAVTLALAPVVAEQPGLEAACTHGISECVGLGSLGNNMV